MRARSFNSEYSGDRAAAGRTFSGFDPVLLDGETAPANQDLPAPRAPGRFRFPPDIPDIDELQSGLPGEGGGFPQRLDRGRRRLSVLVVRMEAADVPGDLGTDGGDEAGDGGQFPVSVIHPRHDECRHLDPDAELAHQPDGIKERVAAGN